VNAWADWSQYPASIKSGATYKGHVWAIPYGMDTRWLYFRRDDLQAAGLPANWTPSKLADVVAAAAAVKAKEANVLPYAPSTPPLPRHRNARADHSFVAAVWRTEANVVTAERQWVGNTRDPQGSRLLPDRLRPKLSPKDPHVDKPWTAMRAKAR